MPAFRQWITRTERAKQLLQEGEWQEFFARLWRKLQPKGPPPGAMHDPERYARWLARQECGAPRPRLASPVMWEILTVLSPGDTRGLRRPGDKGDPQGVRSAAQTLRQAQPAAEVTWLIADCRAATLSRVRPGEPDEVRPLPAEACSSAASAWAFLSAQATAEWLFALPETAALTPNALLWLSNAVEGADVVYGDSDERRGDGRMSPRLHPQWSPERFLHDGYCLSGFGFRRALLAVLGGLCAELEVAVFYDLLLRADERGARFAHVAQVVTHVEPPRMGAAEQRAAMLALARRGHPGEVVVTSGRLRIIHPVTDQPVSIIIPFRDRPELLDRCLESLVTITKHTSFEILLVDNGSTGPQTRAVIRRWQARLEHRLRLLARPGAFNFAWLNNQAVAEAKHPFVLLLNNDTEVIAPEWLDEMLGWASRPEIGAVGCKLLYPDMTLQHAGVVLGVAGAAAHACIGLDAQAPGHAGRLLVPRNVSAVTAACLLVATEKYRAVGGLDEESFRVAFNDLDLCLKLEARGWRTLYTPHAALIHHESKSRGSRVDASEDRAFRHKYGARIAADPFYHPALSRLVPDDRLA